MVKIPGKGDLERAYTLINEAAQLEQCGTASVATMQTVFTSYSSARQSASGSAEYKATRNEELQRRYYEVFGFGIDVDNEELAKVLGCRLQGGVFSCNNDAELKKNGRRFISRLATLTSNDNIYAVLRIVLIVN